MSRTGYTGEDGFELMVDAEYAEALWDRLLAQTTQPVACGLGARDTLRTEAGFALYGHEIDRTTSPFEARLGWVVNLDKDDFVGREALVRQKADGVERRLVGLTVGAGGVPRPETAVVDERRAGRSGDERHALADAAAEHRPRLCTGSARRHWPAARGRGPGSVDTGRGHAAALCAAPLASTRSGLSRGRLYHFAFRRSIQPCPTPLPTRQTVATPASTSGSRPTATSTWSASPRSRRTSSATSSTSSCRKSATSVEAGKAFGVIESVKTASDLYAPVSGEVVAVNASLVEQPQAVNDDPYSGGWMIRIKADDRSTLDQLLTADQYTAQIGD